MLFDRESIETDFLVGGGVGGWNFDKIIIFCTSVMTDPHPCIMN